MRAWHRSCGQLVQAPCWRCKVSSIPFGAQWPQMFSPCLSILVSCILSTYSSNGEHAQHWFELIRLHDMVTAQLPAITSSISRTRMCAVSTTTPLLRSRPFGCATSRPRSHGAAHTGRRHAAKVTCRAESEETTRQKVDEIEEVLTKEPLQAQDTAKGAHFCKTT